VNGLGNWYEQTYHDAQKGLNKFHIIDLDYWEHPDYNNELWVADQKAQLGEKGFRQEVLREFQGSGDTYFATRVLTSLGEQTRNNYPSRKLFPHWANTLGRISQLETEDNRGALWIWKEPVEGHEYLLSADCAEGQGENNDNSVFQIIDMQTLEQVGEFYSNIILPHEFAQVIKEIAIYYYNALVVVENMGPGGAVLSALQHTHFYDNLFFENLKSANAKAGIKMGVHNRTLFLEALQNKLSNGTVLINSSRFVTELNTFEYNKGSKKAMARKGHHDDAIMSMGIGLYVRDTLMRDLPVGSETSRIPTGVVKSEIYDQIKRELMEGRPEDILSDSEYDVLAPDRETVLANMGMPYTERRGERIIREFGF